MHTYSTPLVFASEEYTLKPISDNKENLCGLFKLLTQLCFSCPQLNSFISPEKFYNYLVNKIDAIQAFSTTWTQHSSSFTSSSTHFLLTHNPRQSCFSHLLIQKISLSSWFPFLSFRPHSSSTFSPSLCELLIHPPPPETSDLFWVCCNSFPVNMLLFPCW